MKGAAKMLITVNLKASRCVTTKSPQLVVSIAVLCISSSVDTNGWKVVSVKWVAKSDLWEIITGPYAKT